MCVYLIEGFSEWNEAKLVGFELLNVQGSVEGCYLRDSNDSRHFISVSENFLRRTTPTSTVSSSISVGLLFSTSFTGCGTSIWPIALPRLCLVENLGHHKLSLFFFFVLSQMVLVHHPVCLFWFSVLPEVGVEHQNLLATLLFPIHHHWSCLTCLVPSGFPSLQVAFVLNLSPLSCPCCVSLWGPVEEVSA